MNSIAPLRGKAFFVPAGIFFFAFAAVFFSACDALNTNLKEDIDYHLSLHPVKSGAELASAINDVPSGGAVTFTLMTDIELSSPQTIIDKTVVLEAYAGTDSTVTIRRTGYTGSFFTVNSGGKLILGGNRGRGTLVLDGEGAGTDPLVTVNGGGDLTLNKGAELRNNVRPSGDGGGVNVTGGAFTMTGGTIDGNRANNGGGVYVTGGTFTMTGGTIGGNVAGNDGGGVNVNGGTFTMTGGSISGNTVTGYSAGGVAFNNGTFTMTGGSISGNTANGNGGGVMLTGYPYLPLNRGYFFMHGGSISGNTAGGNGGGIVLQGNAEFTLHEGTISGNKANSGNGGGIWFNDGESKFIMEGGTVSGNMANSGSGGGVYVKNGGYGSGSFTMNGGTIGENTASSGGGVYVTVVYGPGTSSFTMNRGTISGNTASSGNGVYFNDGTFNMSGSGAVLPGNVVYLSSGRTIAVTGALDPPGGIAAVIMSQITTPGTTLVTGSTSPFYSLTTTDVGKFRYNNADTFLDDTTAGEGKIPPP